MADYLSERKPQSEKVCSTSMPSSHGQEKERLRMGLLEALRTLLLERA